MSSADEAAVPVDILKPEVPLTLDDSSTEQVETVIGADQHDQELLHELDHDAAHNLERHLDDCHGNCCSRNSPKAKQIVNTQLAGPGSNQETRETVYGARSQLSARSNKARRGSSPHQAQLPTFRRSLPALSVPTKRLHRELLLERDAFMAQLTREREEKTQLECWAATRIQAYFRGFRSRPRVVAYARRMKKFALRMPPAFDSM
ncbi:IQ motif, EF-hand binding site [Phytophthora cactorum]|nr:IQ motif, EF-hand binding site [Phytophthora cactorum]